MIPESMLNIVIPMSGTGKRFQEAGYAFPKPLIDIAGHTMIDLVARNLQPTSSHHRYIFVCPREQYEQYDLYNIFKGATDNRFETVQLSDRTEGAACTVLMASQYIDNEDELLIANSDQFIDADINEFVQSARSGGWDGAIMTFKARHPKWSYARTDKDGRVLETAEKRLISDNATVGIYYFKHGSDFVRAAQSMIKKDIRYNGEFYVCPVYNELILEGKNIHIFEIPQEKMHGLGTPEDLNLFLHKMDAGEVALK